MRKPAAAKKAPLPRTAPAVIPPDPKTGWDSKLPPWMLVTLIVAVTAILRIRLLNIPLERDEGEYAYAGQLMLQGIPPYRLAFNMKFPGTYAAYAGIMAAFGQSIAGIHVGFLLVSAGTIVLIYLLGRRLFTPTGGVAASAAYALLSIGAGVAGTQAHATHFVMLAALGGTLALLRAAGNWRSPPLFWSGLLFGVAILMKQQAVIFVAFGTLYLLWTCWRQHPGNWNTASKTLGLFLGGVSAPVAFTALVLWRAGVFPKFWFWTVSYAAQYATEVSFSEGVDNFTSNFPDAVGPNLAIWIIALVGLILIWRKYHDRTVAVFATGFLIFSFLAVCPGFYFRNHYFVLLLPAVALLTGAAVSCARIGWPSVSWATYMVFGGALAISVLQQRGFLFQLSPLEISRDMYSGNPFAEAIQIADYIREHSAKDSSIAVLGSEPEIPFYAKRHSATGYIYMYGLMEDQPYALNMQNEMIHDLETSRPEYVVLVTSQVSWLRRPESQNRIFDWWDAYRPQHYKAIGAGDVSSGYPSLRWGDVGTEKLESTSDLVVYRRTDP